jgi:hypothetical protein
VRGGDKGRNESEKCNSRRMGKALTNCISLDSASVVVVPLRLVQFFRLPVARDRRLPLRVVAAQHPRRSWSKVPIRGDSWRTGGAGAECSRRPCTPTPGYNRALGGGRINGWPSTAGCGAAGNWTAVQLESRATSDGKTVSGN